MGGNGYPRAAQARADEPAGAPMLANPDIFEALTSVDRPYKRGKTLGESLTIMARMRDGRLIDTEFFELFLRSAVVRADAERFLEPAQIDEVDIADYLNPAGGRRDRSFRAVRGRKSRSRFRAGRTREPLSWPRGRPGRHRPPWSDRCAARVGRGFRRPR